MRAAQLPAILLIAGVGLACCGCERSGAPASAQVTTTAESSREASSSTSQKATADSRETPAVRDITFDEITFDMEKDDRFVRSMLTSQIEALNDQPIRIRGYILPSYQQTGITQFVLVRDNQECCFGPGAALFDCVLVEMNANESVDYTIRPVAVEGTFSIQEVTDGNGKHLAIYHIDGDTVE